MKELTITMDGQCIEQKAHMAFSQVG